MSFPFGDWQFWAVTATMLGSLWLLVRPFLQRDSSTAPACSNCAQASSGRCGTHEKRDRLVSLGGD